MENSSQWKRVRRIGNNGHHHRQRMMASWVIMVVSHHGVQKARYSNSFMRETRVNKLPSTSQAYAVAGEQPALRTLIEAVRLHIFYATFDARRSSWHQLPEQTWIQAPYTCHFACYLCLDHQSALVYTYTRIHVYCIHVYTYTRIHVYT